VDVTGREAKSISSMLIEMSGVDVTEICSPEKFASQCLRLGLRPGFAVDLTLPKSNGEHWNLNKDRDVEEMMKMLDREDPELLIGSPPCTVLSTLRHLSNFKRDPKVVAEKEDEGRSHIKVSVQAYARQLKKGKLFLHEAPKSASSWKEPDMKWLSAQPGVHRVDGPMCRWEMKQEDEEGEAYVRKETGWLTNCEELAQLLQGICTKKDAVGKAEWHRHIELIGGKARAAQVYPPKLVEGILRCIKKAILARGAVSALELKVAGPTAEMREVWEIEEYQEYWDDVNGGFLDPKLTNKARHVELDWVKKEGVYSYVKRTEVDG